MSDVNYNTTHVYQKCANQANFRSKKDTGACTCTHVHE